MKQISMLYSGGLDTTALATQLAGEYERVHLLLCESGYSVGGPRFAGRQVQLLQSRFGDRIVLCVLNVSQAFRAIMGPFLPLARRWRSPLVFCLCCKLAMEAEEIVYDRRHGIEEATDGNSLAQTEIAIQRLRYLCESERFFARFGIGYRTNPQYDWPRERKRELIARQGFRRGIGIIRGLQRLGINNMSDHFGQQPVCLGALAAFVYTSPVRDLPGLRSFGLDLERAIALRREREPIAVQWVEERLESSSPTRAAI